MSITKRIGEALEQIGRGDAEGALIPACIAVDATAQLEYPTVQGTGARYRQFLRESMWCIGLVGLRGLVPAQVKVPPKHPDLRPGPDGYCTLEDVIYSVVRCGLLHEATIADHVAFSADVLLGVSDSGYELSSSLPLGLVAAVLLSPANRDAPRLPSTFPVGIGRGTIDANDLWGRRAEIERLVAANIL